MCSISKFRWSCGVLFEGRFAAVCYFTCASIQFVQNHYQLRQNKKPHWLANRWKFYWIFVICGKETKKKEKLEERIKAFFKSTQCCADCDETKPVFEMLPSFTFCCFAKESVNLKLTFSWAYPANFVPFWVKPLIVRSGSQ